MLEHVCIFPGPKEERDDLVNPYWIEDKALKRGEVDYMPGAEVQFFKDLIEKYLYPLLKNPQEQVLPPFFATMSHMSHILNKLKTQIKPKETYCFRSQNIVGYTLLLLLVELVVITILMCILYS